MAADDQKNADSPSRFQTFEIEFGDGPASPRPKSAPIQKLYDTPGKTAPISHPPSPAAPQSAYSCLLECGTTINCKLENWGREYAIFGDFLEDAKKYHKKTCISAEPAYFFSLRPMYRELTHEQLCWYLFWRSKVREGAYPKTSLSYIFLYLYEQINLSDVVGCEKAYANMVNVWKSYRAEFPRLDKYVVEWLTDFSLVNRFRINLDDLGGILPDILAAASIPEMFMRGGFFADSGNAGTIIKNLSLYDYTKSKFCTEKNSGLFELHIPAMLHAALSGPEFGAILKKETDEGVRQRATRESYMGAVCAYGQKKKITVEYRGIYKNLHIRQCVTDTVRYAENALREYLGAKSKLPISAYPEGLAKAVERYKEAYLGAAKPKGKKAQDEEPPPPPEFNPDISVAAEIEKDSWDTTMTLVELQSRNEECGMRNEELEETTEETEETEDDWDFIAIDTGSDDNFDIFDILERLDEPEPTELTGIDRFLASLGDLERLALGMLIGAEDGGFDALCGEFLAQSGEMLESVVDSINEKAMDMTGDIVFDAAEGKIVEDYRDEMEKKWGEIYG